ncbi:tRNA epoxyqueuosine(34) reductase QueG [bacterium]|nr:tRNA epoxyqueuosine(34) reductase QueG [bacterium]
MKDVIKQKALELGFDLVGIAPAEPHPHMAFFDEWLGKGYDAGMTYLKRGRDRRANPDLILPGVKSLIVCGLTYHTNYPFSIESTEEGRGWISRYAWGDDYHEVMGEMLQKLEAEIIKLAPHAQTKSYVDTGAILERSYAESAGLGWIGKNTCLINTKKGSFFFIGEILTTLELESDVPDIDHCGKCTRCIDACPTQALKPYELDSHKCISYLTIEHRGDMPSNMASQLGHHLVGCDICQDVCPWNAKAPVTDNHHFKPRPGLLGPSIQELKAMDEESFKTRFHNSPIKRLKYAGLKRNLALAASRPKQD